MNFLDRLRYAEPLPTQLGRFVWQGLLLAIILLLELPALAGILWRACRT